MKNQNYQPTIGLEIHVELKTKTKMFCACLNETWKIGQEELLPNKNICPVCMGHPGTLPVINKEAVKMVIKTGLALNTVIAEKSKFDRKQYFYPDLPKGYQISQYDQPLCSGGYLEINGKKIGITRIHLEEDTGKLSHSAAATLIDYNRAGVPLMELVTEPDISSALEAKEFCQELQLILRELEVSDADMEKGQMRCEVNISLSANTELGTKVEIKNLNSFRSVERAVNYEIERQTKALESGEKIMQETRGWNDVKQETYTQRVKEGSADYRYFPEPDLPPLDFSQDSEIDLVAIKNSLPELPAQKRARFTNAETDFNAVDAKILMSDPLLADYVEQVISELKIWLKDSGVFEGTEEEIWLANKDKVNKLVTGWLFSKLGGLLAARKLAWSQNTISAENFAEFITMLFTRQVSTKNANLLLARMLETGGDPSNILVDENLNQSDDFNLAEVVDSVINNNSAQVEEFKAGKTVLIKFFLGAVMKESKGQADPVEAENMLLQKLS